MKKEYDFSKGERGKFYRPEANLNVPIYLDEQVRRAVSRLAEKEGCDVSEIVNDLLRSDARLTKA